MRAGDLSTRTQLPRGWTAAARRTSSVQMVCRHRLQLTDVDASLELFRGEVSRQFRFLVDRFGFTVAESADRRRVGYAGPPWTIWIIMDGPSRTVETHICHDDGTSQLHLPLELLLRYRGLTAQRPGTSAHAPRAIIRSLGLQAKALARILPGLMASGGRQALRDAGA